MRKITIKDLMTYSPWEIAKDNGLGYTGDLNFVKYDGTFYELSNWAEYGFAMCVNIFSMSEGGDKLVCVEVGTINKPDPKNMSAVLKLSGLLLEDEEDVPIAYEVEAAHTYRGCEVDSTEVFKSDDEYEICRQVKKALLSIKGN